MANTGQTWQLLSPGIVPFLIKKSIGQKRSTNGLGCRQNALDMLKESALIELVTLLWLS